MRLECFSKGSAIAAVSAVTAALVVFSSEVGRGL